MSRPPLDPATRLKTTLSLRAGSLLAFPAGAVALAILQRGWLAVAVLAAVMLAVSLVERYRIGRALGVDLKPGEAGLIPALAMRLGLLTGLFVVTVGVLALFRETALARSLSWIDMAVVGASAAAALVANLISGRLTPLPRLTEPGPPREAPGEGVIIEGEVVDRDPP
jgi:hypothetical protein